MSKFWTVVKKVLTGRFLDTQDPKQSRINKWIVVMWLMLFARGCSMNFFWLEDMKESQEFRREFIEFMERFPADPTRQIER